MSLTAINQRSSSYCWSCLRTHLPVWFYFLLMIWATNLNFVIVVIHNVLYHSLLTWWVEAVLCWLLDGSWHLWLFQLYFLLDPNFPLLFFVYEHYWIEHIKCQRVEYWLLFSSLLSWIFSTSRFDLFCLEWWTDRSILLFFFEYCFLTLKSLQKERSWALYRIHWNWRLALSKCLVHLILSLLRLYCLKVWHEPRHLSRLVNRTQLPWEL